MTQSEFQHQHDATVAAKLSATELRIHALHAAINAHGKWVFAPKRDEEAPDVVGEVLAGADRFLDWLTTPEN
jgi:hypothetical protein